jgi:hypothetical protein
MHRPPAFLLLFAPLALAACGGGQQPAAVPLPSYGIGDTYSFDDGSVRTVITSEGNMVSWRDDGAPVVTRRDVLLPPLEITEQGHMVRRQVISADLFPLVPGKHAIFVVTQLSASGASSDVAQETGECIVRDGARTDTPAGSFDTIRVDCTAQDADDAQARRSTYFFAPSIGYFVRRDDRVGDGPWRSIQLVRYAPGAPPLSNEALQQRTRAIQHALESQLSNASVAWRDPSGEASGTIAPVLTEHLPSLGWCREFREQMLVAGRHYDLLGTACRARGGTWMVREITPYRAAS